MTLYGNKRSKINNCFGIERSRQSKVLTGNTQTKSQEGQCKGNRGTLLAEKIVIMLQDCTVFKDRSVV